MSTPEAGAAGAAPPAAALAQHIQAEVSRGLTAHLFTGAPTAEGAHLVVALVVGAALWGELPGPALAGWVAAIAALVGLRYLLRRTARLPAMRAAVVLLGVAWGAGALIFAPQIHFVDYMFLLVALSALLAGATNTLAADTVGFRLYLGTLMLALAGGVLRSNADHLRAAALVILALFIVLAVRLQRDAYRTLVATLRSNALLSWNEAEADRERRHLDALFASAPIAIAVVDRDQRVQRINPRFTSLFGYEAAEVVGRNIDDLITPKAELPRARRMSARTRQGETVVAEIERRRKDGWIVPLRVSSAAIAGSEREDVLVMYEDITDRRRAAEALTRLASIVESSQDAIIGQSLDGAIVTWNAAAARMFGYSLGEVQGKPVDLLVPPDRAAEAREIIGRVGRGEAVSHFETVRLRKGGTPVPVAITVSVTREPDGRIAGYSTIARDVGLEVAAREALEEARDVAERAARARSAFLANMSHEIRTPMNAVLGLSELLLDTDLSPEQRRTIDLIRNSGESLLDILNDVLDFSKIEAEHLTLETIPFDLAALVDSTARLLAVRARDRHLELLCDVAADVPPMVRGDPTRLRQVLTNLVSNAIKFTPKGEIVVAVRAEREGAAARVRFAVRDTGIGIPPEKLELIFEEFQQADVSTTRHYGGTGLGLAIARRLVHLMGGELGVTSQVGRGTEFSFTVKFPVEAPPAPAAAPAATLPAALRGERVLVVDDNDTSRRIVCDILAAIGAQVDAAARAEATLEQLRRAAREGRPHVLAVIDAQLPGEDGYALAARINADPTLRATRLLMLTSVGRRGDAERCRELGIRGYLTKPVARADLLETVAAVLSAPGPEAGGPELVTRHLIQETRRHLRILLAEDNPVNQEVASAMLRRRGHHVDVVSDGQAAVDAFGAGRYDVVLMDVQMPVLDGFAATQRIRASEGEARDLPIIAVTAHALAGERERCLAAGMSGYLAKPFQAHDLFAAVEGWAPALAAAPADAAGSAAPVDLDEFRAELEAAGAADALPKVVATFLSNAPERRAAVRAACAARDAGQINRAMHAYKSAAGTIRARALAAILLDGEAAARRGDVEAAAALLPRIEAEHDSVVAYLTSVQSPGRGSARRKKR